MVRTVQGMEIVDVDKNLFLYWKAKALAIRSIILFLSQNER